MRYTLLIYFLFSSLFSTECSAPLLGAAHSGAPGEVNCSGCHSGVINSGPGIVDYLIGTGNSFYSSRLRLSLGRQTECRMPYAPCAFLPYG